MTITRVGTTDKYASGWELAFGKGKKTSVKAEPAKKATTKGIKKAAAKKVTKKAKTKAPAAPAKKKAAPKKKATKKH